MIKKDYLQNTLEKSLLSLQEVNSVLILFVDDIVSFSDLVQHILELKKVVSNHVMVI